MKILVIGGTRFLGKRFVEILLANDHQVTVISRHPKNCPAGALVVGGDRFDGVKNLTGQKFDFIFDFIGYDTDGPNQIFKLLKFKTYVLISSTWVTRIHSDSLSKDELRYISKKIEAETAALSRWRSDHDTTVLRLPILFGKNDHTGRLEFYGQRILDGYPLILVNGGKNIAQIVWVEDVAQAMNLWVKQGSFTNHKIWDSLPDKGKSATSIVKNIALALGKKSIFINISSKILSQQLPEYLTAEPLWKLATTNVGEANLFRIVGYQPTSQKKWLESVVGDTRLINSKLKLSELRQKEIIFLRHAGYTSHK